MDRELLYHGMCGMWSGEEIIMPWNVYSVGWRGNYAMECVGSRMWGGEGIYMTWNVLVVGCRGNYAMECVGSMMWQL